MAVYLAFRKKSSGMFGKLIRWWTGSAYSHCELAWAQQSGRFLCYSSSEDDGGSRMKVMELPVESWDLIAVQINMAESITVLEWCRANVGKPYDWAGIFGMVWNPRKDNPGRYFCSEFCLRALQEAGWGVGLVPAKIGPGLLAEYAKGVYKIGKVVEDAG